MSLVLSNKTQRIVSDVIGKNINSPEQRMLQGIVALAIQPAIDFRNKDTDEDTRIISTARTIGKIVAGTLVGFAVRKASILLVRQMSQRLPSEEIACLKGVKKLKVLFTPYFSKIPKDMQNGDPEALYNNYLKTMGTIIGTAAGLFTNFLVDVPLTKFITDKMTPKVKNMIKKEKQGDI